LGRKSQRERCGTAAAEQQRSQKEGEAQKRDKRAMYGAAKRGCSEQQKRPRMHGKGDAGREIVEKGLWSVKVNCMEAAAKMLKRRDAAKGNAQKQRQRKCTDALRGYS